MCTPIVSALNMEQLFTCPYEPAHRIRRFKIRVHLQKCRKNHPSSDMRTCCYNVDHIVPSIEYSFHLETCEDRIKGDRYRWTEETAVDENNDDDNPAAGTTPELVPLWAMPDIEIDEDDWSMSRRPVAQGSINEALQAQLREKKVIVPKQGATKSERKAHYMEERRRHNQFEDIDQPSTSRAAPQDKSQPLRKPKSGSVAVKVESTPVQNTAPRLPKSAPAQTLVQRFVAAEPLKKPQAPQKSQPPKSNENQNTENIFPKGRGRVPGDNVSSIVQSEPRVGSVLSESIINATAKFSIDADGFCTLPIPNKGRGRKLNPVA